MSSTFSGSARTVTGTPSPSRGARQLVHVPTRRTGVRRRSVLACSGSQNSATHPRGHVTVVPPWRAAARTSSGRVRAAVAITVSAPPASSLPAEGRSASTAGRAAGRSYAAAAHSRHSPGHALQLVLAAVLERDPRADDEVLDRARHEHLAGPALSPDPRADVDGEPPDVVADQLDLARMQTAADLQPELRSGARPGSPSRNESPRAGPSNVARNPSPIVLTARPRKRESSRPTTLARSTRADRASAGRPAPQPAGSSRRCPRTSRWPGSARSRGTWRAPVRNSSISSSSLARCRGRTTSASSPGQLDQPGAGDVLRRGSANAGCR